MVQPTRRKGRKTLEEALEEVVWLGALAGVIVIMVIVLVTQYPKPKPLFFKVMLLVPLAFYTWVEWRDFQMVKRERGYLWGDVLLALAILGLATVVERVDLNAPNGLEATTMRWQTLPRLAEGVFLVPALGHQFLLWGADDTSFEKSMLFVTGFYSAVIISSFFPEAVWAYGFVAIGVLLVWNKCFRPIPEDSSQRWWC